MNAKHTLKYAEEPGLDELVVVRKFNEWMIEARNEPVPKMLFGRMWLEGEMAVLSADAGAGKSILAVQIAEAIAGGQQFAPFEMTAEPQKVLYLNLKLSTKQFAMRYAEEHDAEDGEALRNQHEFPDNLIRVDIDLHGKLPEGYNSFDEVLAPLVHRLVKKTEAKVVIIDNITLLQRSVYGYRETYAMMRSLDKLKRRLGISILVLARTAKQGGSRESSAGSCSSLFSRFADSVFMIGQSRLDPSARYIKQVIVHSSEMIYNSSHVASLCIRRIDGNRLEFVHYGFDPESEHKYPITDDRLYPTIDKVKTLTDAGKSIREIAAELNLPKTTVHRYLQMWTAEIGEAMKERTPQPYDPTQSPFYFPGREEYDEAKQDPKFKLLYDTRIPDDDPRFRALMREYGLIDDACARAHTIYKQTGAAPMLDEDAAYAEFVNPGSPSSQSCQANLTAMDSDKLPAGIPPGTKRGLDANGREIFIEKERDDGKPVIWYSFDSKGRKQKHVRDSWGITITRDKDPDQLE